MTWWVERGNRFQWSSWCFVLRPPDCILVPHQFWTWKDERSFSPLVECESSLDIKRKMQVERAEELGWLLWGVKELWRMDGRGSYFLFHLNILTVSDSFGCIPLFPDCYITSRLNHCRRHHQIYLWWVESWTQIYVEILSSHNSKCNSIWR